VADHPAPVVVITGASSGIGRVTARRFAANGASVVLAARTESSLQDAAAECTDAGGRALVVPTDVTDWGAVERLAERAVAAYGRIDVWVNNASVMAYGEAEEIPYDVFTRVVEVNLMGTIHGTTTALRHMKRQGGGTIVNVASLYAKMTSPYVTPYVTSKFGVLGFSEVVRQELAAHDGIELTTVLPGSMDTPIFRHAATYLGRHPRPVPPVSDPERVARAIVRAARRPRREVTVGQTQHLLSWAHAIFPGLYGRLAPPVMRRAGLEGDDAEAGPGNVLEPMPEWNRPEGDWRNGRRRAVAAAAVTGVAATVAGVAGVRSRR
jgi:short-subunit dehydrogenase